MLSVWCNFVLLLMRNNVTQFFKLVQAISKIMHKSTFIFLKERIQFFIKDGG